MIRDSSVGKEEMKGKKEGPRVGSKVQLDSVAIET
jgi:hypothetical protein